MQAVQNPLQDIDGRLLVDDCEAAGRLHINQSLDRYSRQPLIP
jgi:hypothetical protein